MKNRLVILCIQFLGLYCNLFSQDNCAYKTYVPNELYRGRYQEVDMIYGHPYTMFDKHNGFSFQQTIENIRKRIIEEYKDSTLTIEQRPVYRAYKRVYENANNPKPTDDGLGPKEDGKYIGISSLAIWAKNCAFVFLIGLVANGNKFGVLSSMFEVKLTYNLNLICIYH